MTEKEAIKMANGLFGPLHQWDAAVALKDNSFRGADEVWLVASSKTDASSYALVDIKGGDLMLRVDRKP